MCKKTTENRKQFVVHESILISRLKEGDEWAYEVLFREYALLLTSYANSIVEDTDLAKEIVQSLFVSLWESRQNLQINQSLKSYLYISVRNNAIKVLQKQKREQEQMKNLQYNSVEEFRTEMETIEFREKVFRAIEKLPDNTKTYFKLSRFKNMTYDEIAKELDVSKKNVEYHMSRAIRILQESILLFCIFFNFFS